ncbi:MAG: hypothetical protein MK179_01150 [Pirellulaceae bacterium]|nr:hypothetical protein [Pirellulaceae bacterium]
MPSDIQSTTQSFLADEHELESYQAISPCAPLAVIAGLASPLALIHPLLWTVPLSGILVAWIGIKQVSSDTGYTGRRALLLGLALSLFFASFPPVRYLTIQWMLSRQAKQIAADWIELLRLGDLQQAHQWTIMPEKRAGKDASLAKFYESSASSLADLNRLQARQDVKRFREKLTEHTVHLRIEGILKDGHTYQVILDCQPQSASGSPITPAIIRLSIRREKQRGSGEKFWRLLVVDQR